MSIKTTDIKQKMDPSLVEADAKTISEQQDLSANALKCRRIDHDAAYKNKQQELGWVGKILGDRKHAPNAIVLITITLSFLFLALGWFVRPELLKDQSQFLTFFTNLIIGCVGYCFGNFKNNG